MLKDKVIAIIPARMAASRFPGKPLAKLLDLPMIEHVRRRVELSESVDKVYVATCDKEIFDTVEKSGGKAIMTSNAHERCTDRVEEAARSIDADIIVIFQADEPLFEPQTADLLLDPLRSDKKLGCVNLLSTIKTQKDFDDFNVVKAVLNKDKMVLYFSRLPIPYLREKSNCNLYRQTGISAFRKEFLTNFSKLAPTPLEVRESIDFLRILEHGYDIYGVVLEQQLFGVDEPEHVSKVESILQSDSYQNSIYKTIINKD